MKVSIATILIMCSSIFSALGATGPDFAFPKKVIAASRSDLNKALDRGDGDAALSCLLAIEVATSMQDADSVPRVLTLMDEAIERSKPVDAALIRLLEASVLSAAYNQERYVYNRRELPLRPLDPDFRLWSGEQMRSVIDSLVNQSLSDPGALAAVKIGAYPRSISCPARSKPYYPTLLDFVCDVAQRLTDDSGNRFQRLLAAHSSEGSAPALMARLALLTDRQSTRSSGESFNDSIMALYRSYADSRYGWLALDKLNVPHPGHDTPAQVNAYIDTIDAYLRRFPTCDGAGALRNAVNNLLEPQVTLRAGATVVPGGEMRVAVTAQNVARFTIFLVPCRMTDGEPQHNISSKRPALPPVMTRRVDIRRERGAVTADTITITAPVKPGYYMIVPSISGAMPKSGWYQSIHVTALSLSTAGLGNTVSAYVVNPLTGAPEYEGVTLDIVSRERSTAKRDQIAAGSITPLPKGSYIITARRGDMTSESIRLYDYRSDAKRRRLTLLTDRPLYHPGEEIHWCVIAQRADSATAEVISGAELKVTLYDVDHQTVDTTTVITDSFGRADGTFTTAKEGLTGLFRLAATGDNDMRGSCSIEVSDYRLPTFEVTIPTVRRDMPDTGGATVEGRAVTYSGVPVAGAKVALTLARTSFFRFGGSEQVAAFETFTDAEGNFTLEIPSATFGDSDLNAWMVTANVTSQGGETATGERRFSLGRPYAINVSAGPNIDAAVKCRIMLSLVDINGEDAEAPVEITLANADSTASRTFTLNPGSRELDLSSLPSGTYTLTARTVDRDLAEPVTRGPLYLYRLTDPLPPATGQPFWMPSDRITADNSGHASLIIGTASTLHAVMLVQAADSLTENRWITLAPGIHTLPIDMPEGVDELKMMLIATRDYTAQQATVSIRRGSGRKPLTIVAESFRDKLLTGSTETWRFRITDAEGKGEKAAVVLDMYNRAIEALADPNFYFRPLSPDRRRLTANVNYFSTQYWSDHIARRSPSWRPTKTPDWITWGYPLYHAGRSMMFRSMKSSSRVANFATDDMVMEENAVFASYDAAPMALAGGAMMKNEAETEEEVAETTDDAGTDGDATATRPQVRPSEVALAFFRPMLTSDADGSLTFSFTAPQANSEWVLRALAYTADLRSDEMERTIVTSKPVMVSANPPRFLYAGDRAEVAATVMNTTDSAMTASTVTELFDPATGRIIATFTETSALPPHGSAVVTADVEAPLEGALLGYRVRTSTGTFTDGEQHIIRLLQPSAPVIDAYPFYAAPAQQELTMKLPAVADSASVTLQYCDNPSWYVALALPGLRSGEPATAPQASRAIFSAAIAEGLLREHPAIADALREWTASPTDTTLRSLLERDPDLKLMLLSATPWVADAMSQTARMERLALLFDQQTTSQCYSTAMELLTSLADPAGGWRWSKWSEQASDWATRSVLADMGRLRQLGMMPQLDGLDKMLRAALDAVDRRVADRQSRQPDMTDTGYLTLIGYFGEHKLNQRCQRVVDNTLRYYRRDWRRMDAGAKAEAALALLRHGDRATADTIVASMRDFATVSADKGMWWPSADTGYEAASDGAVGTTARVLEAFAAVNPRSADIDLIRQWLILQKEALDWGDGTSTSDAIAAILSTGTDWTRPQTTASLRLGRKTLTPTSVESRLGYLRMELPPRDASKATLRVKRQAEGPAWGAVYIRQRLNLSDIAPASVPDLSIEKQLFRRVMGADGKFAQAAADTLRVGDVVQVNLTIRAGRDIDYVTITDLRGACFAPTEQLSGRTEADGVVFYRENRDTQTNLFIDRLPRGVYRLSYTLYVNNAGTFTSGAATIQSALAPALTARSAAPRLTTLPRR